MTKDGHKPRIAVLKGGPSEEHTLSMQNGAEVAAVLRAAGKHDVIDITVTKNGEWLEDGFVRTPQDILNKVDSVYIGLHGLYGEDGGVQREIERAGVRYQGSKPFQSAVGLNKMLTKEHVKNTPVKKAGHLRLTKSGVSDVHSSASTTEKLLGGAFIVKPTCGGSGIDTKVANGAHELAKVLEELFETYDDVLVEQRINGVSITCGVINDLRGTALYTTPATEVLYDQTAENDIFVAEKIVPGRFTKDIRAAVAEYAKRIHMELDLRDMSRSDFIVTDEGEIYFLEVNTLPAVTNNSPLMVGMASLGVSQEELVCHLCGDKI